MLESIVNNQFWRDSRASFKLLVRMFSDQHPHTEMYDSTWLVPY